MSEKQILTELSVDNVRSNIENICSTIPSRLAGSESGVRMADYSLKQLQESGLDARIHTIPALVSFPEAADLKVLYPEQRSLPANTLGHSIQTLPEGLEGELVYVDSGFPEDYEGKDVAGKITLSELSYSPARHQKHLIAAERGSIAQIMRNWGHPENIALPYGSIKQCWGNPTPETMKTEMPTIPCIGISRVEGQHLIELLKRGRVGVKLATKVKNVWKDIKVTTGEFDAPGSQDFVLLGGHQDSWFGPQATDNAAGNACIMELVRVFSKHRDKLRRGVMVGFWAAHETGTMVGSSWFVDHYWDRLREHAVAYIQIDQPGFIGTTRWRTRSNAEMYRFHQEIERRLLHKPIDWHLAVKTGDSSLFGMGVPMLTAGGTYTQAELDQTANATLGWWHHSIENTIDKLDWSLMEELIRIHGAYVWELCTAPIIPYDFTRVADCFIERLQKLGPAGRPLNMIAAIDRAKELRNTAERLNKETTKWQERYRSGTESNETPAGILNTCIKRLSRMLIPVVSTEKGTYAPDTYGYIPQSTIIPGLYDMTRLERLPHNNEERCMLETKLIRVRNKVADTLADATREIEQTLRQLD